jgi:hypothetical protein
MSKCEIKSHERLTTRNPEKLPIHRSDDPDLTESTTRKSPVYPIQSIFNPTRLALGNDATHRVLPARDLIKIG